MRGRVGLLLVVAAAATALAATPTPIMNAYFTKGFGHAEYQQAVVDAVGKHWQVPRPLPPKGKKAVVLTTLSRSGALVDVQLHLKSGNAGFDQAALAAVKAAAPFPKLPKDWPGALDIHWHFEMK